MVVRSYFARNASAVSQGCRYSLAAARSIGKYGLVAMENYNNEVFSDFSSKMKALIKAGDSVGERLAVQPFWDAYKQELKSSVADIKNLGGAEAGHITAGKFLEYFVDDQDVLSRLQNDHSTADFMIKKL